MHKLHHQISEPALNRTSNYAVRGAGIVQGCLAACAADASPCSVAMLTLQDLQAAWWYVGLDYKAALTGDRSN